MFGFGKKQDSGLPPEYDPYYGGGMMGMPKTYDPFTSTKEMMLAQQYAPNRDAEVLIKLFSLNTPIKGLLSALTGKMYNPETQKIEQIGTAHMNALGVHETMIYISGLFHEGTSKGRLTFDDRESQNANLYFQLCGWLARNRPRFEVRIDSIRVIATIFSDFHYNTLTRAEDGKESDNLLQHAIHHTDTSGQTKQPGIFESLTQRRRSHGSF